MVIITGISPKLGSFELEEAALREMPVYRYDRNEQNTWDILQPKSNHCNRWSPPFLRIWLMQIIRYTCRAYATDLAQLCAFHQGPIQTITTDVLRTFFERHTHLRPATRARKQAAVARFLTWAEQQELLDSNPMRKIDRVKLD
jgi:hypothetical protein